jgi:hypothetical protein
VTPPSSWRWLSCTTASLPRSATPPAEAKYCAAACAWRESDKEEEDRTNRWRKEKASRETEDAHAESLTRGQKKVAYAREKQYQRRKTHTINTGTKKKSQEKWFHNTPVPWLPFEQRLHCASRPRSRATHNQSVRWRGSSPVFVGKHST